MAVAVRHTGIVVRDLEAALAFYEGLLGFSVVRRMEEQGGYLDNMLGLPGARVTTVKMDAPGGGALELLRFSDPAGTPGAVPEINAAGFTHVAFTVGNLEELYEELLASGVVFNAPPQTAPDGGAKVTFCRDPEGNFLELVEVLRR